MRGTGKGINGGESFGRGELLRPYNTGVPEKPLVGAPSQQNQAKPTAEATRDAALQNAQQEPGCLRKGLEGRKQHQHSIA